MNCEELLKQMSGYIDRELAEKLIAHVEKHLEACGNCTAVFNTLKKTVELYRQLDVDMPSGTHQKLYKTLNLEDFS